MTRLAPSPPRSLRDVFAHMLSPELGEVRHIVAMTYEFDDQQLVNLLAGRAMDEPYEPRRFDLQRIAQLAPVVIYDARKTAESNAVPHFMDLLPVRMPAHSCHHPKACLLVHERAVHLVVGSMNLTRTGLFSNREVFHAFRWDAAHTDDLQVLADFADLLEHGHAQDFGSASLHDAVRTVRARIAAWRRPDDPPARYTLLASGYGRSGLAQLARHWRAAAGGRAPEGVIAVSPFFDRGTADGTLAADLMKELGAFRELHIVTDEDFRDKLSQAHFAGVAARRLETIAAAPDPAERERIRRANDIGAAALGKLELQRKLHAKLLVVHGHGQVLAYLGSANFTRKAWGGANRELGLVWRADGALDTLRAHLRTGLSVQTGDRYPALDPTIAPPPADEDDYDDLPGYPDFVRAIELLADTDERQLRFRIHLAAPAAEATRTLADYTVCWGDEVLGFDAQGLSTRPLRAATLFARLAGGRNLRFTLTDQPERSYFLPFRHAPALFERREIALHPDPLQWMGHLLGDTPRVPGPDDLPPSDVDAAPGRPPQAGPDRDGDAGRAGNAMVRMQAYLTQFARCESLLRERATQALAAPDAAALWARGVARPIDTLAALLANDTADTPTARQFKLGELALLWRSLPRPAGMARAAVPAWFPADVDEPLMRHYLTWCQTRYDA